MLQNVEYQPAAYTKWLLRTRNFSRVMYRRKLEPTKAALLFRWCSFVVMIILYANAAFMAFAGYGMSGATGLWLALVLFILVPIMTASIMVAPLVVARLVITNPKEKRLISASKAIFSSTKAVKIAVAGSYGKTSMKEMLGTVLAQGKKVAITPANKNVASSHAIFARGLTGDEDVLVVEFGEGKPGDVERFSQTLKQDIVVITGIAPAHLDAYASLDDAAKDIFSAAAFVPKVSVYVNAESQDASSYIKPDFVSYSRDGAANLKVTDVVSELTGVSFVATSGVGRYSIKTKLVGRHMIGPISAVIAISEKLGLTIQQVEKGAALLVPYEHRMQPRQLANGAWILDDTYNGNIEGIEAGLLLLKEQKAKRKIYVTPGLVDQGVQTETVHKKMGNLIAECAPELVVLMKNSVTSYIELGMQESGFSGEVRIESDPLDFYTNIEQLVAMGDVVLMQNDWPDNYS